MENPEYKPRWMKMGQAQEQYPRWTPSEIVGILTGINSETGELIKTRKESVIEYYIDSATDTLLRREPSLV